MAFLSLLYMFKTFTMSMLFRRRRINVVLKLERQRGSTKW